MYRPLSQALFILIIFPFVYACTSGVTRIQRGVYIAPQQEVMIGATLCDKEKSPETWSVVIGINKYQDPGIPDLTGAAQDAWNFYHYLTHRDGAKVHPRRTKLLINEYATKVNIDEALGEFLTQACPKDRVIIYFAGHGAPEPDRPEDAFLLVHDTSLSRLVSTALSMNQLPQFLSWRANTAGKLLFFVDACHSGVIQFPGSRGITAVDFNSKDVERLRAHSLLNSLSKVSERQKGWGVISSSASDQLSGEGSGECKVGDQSYDGGLFTCALLNAIHPKYDQNRDGELSYNEIYDSVASYLTAMRGELQTPQRSGNLDDNELIFQSPIRPVPIPPLAERYVKDFSARPYRPWIYSTIAASTLSLGVGLYYQAQANDQSDKLNGYLGDQLMVKSSEGYQAGIQERASLINQSKWSFVGAALLGVALSTLSTLEFKSGPAPVSEVYKAPPEFFVGGSHLSSGDQAKLERKLPQ